MRPWGQRALIDVDRAVTAFIQPDIGRLYLPLKLSFELSLNGKGCGLQRLEFKFGGLRHLGRCPVEIMLSLSPVISCIVIEPV